MKKSMWLFIAICSSGLLNGCGTSAPPPPPPPPVATHFSVTSANASPTAGTAFNITVTALDSSNVVVPSYVGTVHFTSSDALAVLPADTAMADGTGTFSATLNTAGPQTITTTDTRSLKGTSSAIAVVAPQIHFTVVAATYLQTIGTPLSFTVTAANSTGTTVTTYSGIVHFTSNDSKAVLPADSPLVSGVGKFSATLNTSGNESITATDTSNAAVTGSTGPLPVSGPTTHFSVSNNSGISVATRKFIIVGVNPLDASNNWASSYTGTVHITSSDGKAILPANTAAQNGTLVVQVTFETAGDQTITATDIATASITGTSSPISVTATPSLAITSGAPPNGTVASTYGPTTTNYFLCVYNPQLNYRTCHPCVPNTSACGGSPTNPYPGCRRAPLTATCVTSVTYKGFQLTGAGGVPPYTWSATSLPPGLSLKFTSPEELIAGTPTPGSAATYNTMVTLSDSGMPPAPFNATYQIVINNPPPPVVRTSPLFPGATVNQPFSYTFSATAGLPPYQNWTEKGALPPGIAPLTSAGVLSGTPTMIGSFPIMVTVDDSLGQMSAAQAFNFQVYQHGFKADGTMGTPRTSHTATLLTDGTVLLAGGLGLSTAEKYDPGTGKFSPTTGGMSVARSGHTATLLKNGKVLITGGQAAVGNPAYATAELFDPATGLFTPTVGNMSVARIDHTATLLASGLVLITGGFDGSNYLATSELFDPGTGSFSPTGSLGTARNFHTATLLNDGKVLVAGGFNNAGLVTAELYDPMTKSFSATSSMAAARVAHTATLLTAGLNSGKVLIAGGTQTTATAEIYDPTTGSFSSTGSMATTRAGQTATLLGDGTVLVVGGSGSNILGAAELFDPNNGTFTGTGSLLTPREAHTATLLKDGTVLVTGGVDSSGSVLATAELYQ